MALPLKDAPGAVEARSAPEAADKTRRSPLTASSGLGRLAEAHKHLKGQHEAKIALLAPRLADLAFRAGDYGVDAGDTRRLGLRAGIITGQETGRALSWLAAVPRRANLVPAGFRPEFNDSGNRPMRYLHPAFATDEVKRLARWKPREIERAA